MPIYASSLGGSVNFTNVTVSYSYGLNPVRVNLTRLQRAIARLNQSGNVTLTFASTTSGILEVFNVNYTFAGGNASILVRAHTIDYGTNATRNFTYFYSGWNRTLPPNVRYLEFIPNTATSKNVTPYGQTAARPIFNMSAWNYGAQPFNFSILLNGTDACVNLSIGNTSNRSLAVPLTGPITWRELQNQTVYQARFGFWLWADYQCNSTTWRLWQPRIYYRACAVGSLCSNATS